MNDAHGAVCRLTMVAEGTSDRALVPLIERLLDIYCLRRPYRMEFADPFDAQGHDVGAKIRDAARRFPCEVLLVHRDADSMLPHVREEEIRRACAEAGGVPALVSVIPVRETEAWLLVDAQAIRAAVGNPHGQENLDLPIARQIEKEADPKSRLYEALRRASGLSPRRLQKFRPQEYLHRVSDLMNGLDPLRQLTSFAHLESQIRSHFAVSI